MKFIYRTIIITAIILPAILAFGSVEKGSEKGGKLRGKVMETDGQTPIEYANLVVYSYADSSMVSGTITGPDGEFTMADLPEGEFYLVVNFIGYEKKTISDIVIAPNHRNIDLGTIPLRVSAYQLTTAEIVAERQSVEYKIDRKIVNVDQDISAAGGSAADVLSRVPSIRVDVEGTVYLRGTTNYTVYIDGKPSVLKGSEALQQLPANVIENIEIITNPSARYDPDGTSGIINVVLKKNRLKGLSGVVDASAGTGDKYSSDLYFNYRNGKFNVYGGMEWNDRTFPSKGVQQRKIISGDTVQIRESYSDEAWMRNGMNFKGGLDFFADDKTTVSFGGEYGDYGFGWDRFSKVYNYTDPASGDSWNRSNNSFRWKRSYYSLNGIVKRQFNQEGHELSLLAFYSRNDGSQLQDNQEVATDEKWNPIGFDPEMLRSTEAGPSKNFRMELGYIRPIREKGKLEAGYTFRLDDEAEDYTVETFDHDRGEWAGNENYTRNSLFYRNIHALYGVFSHSFGGFEYQLGLRGEYTYRRIEATNTGARSVVDRFDYFPTVHITRRLNEKNQFLASYSRRIERPRGWYLEPFETYVDESTRRLGNPNLLPEYTGSFELGYLRTLKAGTFSVESYYRQTDNKITTVQTFDEESGLVYYTYENLNNDKALGVEGSLIYDITKWFNLNLSGTWYYYRIQDLTGETGSYRHSNNWDGRMITMFRLPSKTSIQLNLSWFSPTVTAQGRAESSWQTDVSIRQEFLDKKLSATLKAADIFATRTRVSYTSSEGIYIYDSSTPEARVLTLTLSYRLNNYRANPALKGSGGMDM